MAIVQCSNCGRRISSFNKVCPHCDFAHGDISREEQERIRARRRRLRLDRAANLSYLALAVLVAGAVWWWFSPPEGWVLPPPPAALILVGLGASLYLAARGWALWIRSSRY